MQRFTQDQIQTYNDAFQMFDREDRGFFASTELREILKIIGYNPTDKLLENLTIVIDADGNGQIEFNEFIDLIDKLETEEKANKEARDCFNAFDFLGEGYVSANDIKEALMHIMEKSSEQDKSNILKYFKLEQNRKISFDEFKEMVISDPPQNKPAE